MLLNLKIEIARKKISQAKISKRLRMTQKTMSKKVTCKSEFTRAEMYTIHDEFFPETDMYYLFKQET